MTLKRAINGARWRAGESIRTLRGLPADAMRAFHGRPAYLERYAPAIRSDQSGELTEVDAYWSEWTVNSKPFATAKESARYLEWRFDEYPLFREFAGLWGDHGGEVVLDYGCGPGNDVTGLLLYSGAEKLIAVDISRKALELTRRRLALHKVDQDRVELIHSPDAKPAIPLPDDHIDYFQSMGVIHITTDPGAILHELKRILRPGGMGRVMVYNRDSLWFHLYTAYQRMILDGDYAGLSVEEAFQRTTDGEDCPIARSYSPQEFEALCEAAGFETTFVGGHHSKHELDLWAQLGEAAKADERLGDQHRQFLSELEFDEAGYPLWRGKHAGVGAVFELRT